jgi:hypothetical protein
MSCIGRSNPSAAWFDLSPVCAFACSLLALVAGLQALNANKKEKLREFLSQIEDLRVECASRTVRRSLFA